MSFSLPGFCFKLTAISLLAGALCQAQVPAPEPPALTQLRASFEQRARIASGALNDYYERALASLEATVATAGDYEQARMIKTRRDELLSITRALPIRPADSIPLPADAARLVGGVTTRTGALINWRTSACSADWVLPRLPPGNYHLQFSYTMTDRPPEPGATGAARIVESATEALFSLREVSLLSSAAKNTRTLKLTSTRATPQTLMTDVPLELTRPPVTLRLAVEATYPGNLITITEVALLPVAATASPVVAVGPPVTLSSEWQQFQKTMSQRLAEARKPAVNAYVATLRGMLPKEGQNDELAAKIEGEQRRALRQVEAGQPRTPAGMKLDSFEDLEGVTFVPDPANLGDRFKVEHQGRQFTVRLAWIACPPVDSSDRRRVKLVTERFGADELEVLNLGRNAQEFTALYLEGRPLRMLVRQSKKHEDEVMALVFLNDIGLFQSVLLDRGLAVMDAPASQTSGSMEQGLLKGMMEREDAARRHKNPPGGWALRSKP